MTLTQPLRILLVLATAASLMWLPWPLTIVFIFASGLMFPPLALLFGVLADVLYYSGHGYYLATLFGVALTGLCYFVRYFVKTRIM